MQSIITDSTITLISETGPSVIGKTHPNFYKIKKALLQKNFLEVENMLDVKDGYKEFSNGRIAVDGDNLIYDGAIIHNVLTQRIVEMIHNGDEATPMLNFLVNLMDNPSEGSIDQLYTFLEHENLPITEDGCFLAYKAINRDYTDKYTGTISNKIGDKVKMPYEEVTADPTKHCSSGLHCGSIDYVRSYGNFKTDENGEHTGDRLVTVKVNPNAVVSVPEDSDRQKVRVYRYVVHEEIENPYDLVPKYEAPVYYDDEDVFGDDDYDDFETWEEDGPDDSNLYSEKGPEGPAGFDCANPVEGLIDFDDPQRSESIIAGCIRQSTDNPLKKNSFETDDIVGDVDVDMFDAMYNSTDNVNKESFQNGCERNTKEKYIEPWDILANSDYATGQPSEKNSFDSVEKTNKSDDSFSYDWYGIANTDWDVIHTIKNDRTREDLHPKAQKIFEYYENIYGTSDLDSTVIESIKSDLKDAGFNPCGFPLEESKDQKNFLDEMFQDVSCYVKKDTEKNSFDVVDKDSNEESVVEVEKPNNIILPDNN